MLSDTVERQRTLTNVMSTILVRVQSEYLEMLGSS